MSKIIDIDFKFRAKQAKARVAALAEAAIADMKQVNLEAEVKKARQERQMKIVLEQMEVAFRNAYHLFGPDVARSRVQFVQSKVDLDYGVVRIL